MVQTRSQTRRGGTVPTASDGEDTALVEDCAIPALANTRQKPASQMSSLNPLAEALGNEPLLSSNKRDKVWPYLQEDLRDADRKSVV